MRKIPMKFLFRPVLLTVMIGLWALPRIWADKPEGLVRAWEEYQFLSLDVAEKLFSEVLKQEAVDAEYLNEAKVGLAMVAQFRERNPDLAKAESLYREVLAANPKPEVAVLVNSFLADIHISRNEKDQALQLLDTLVAEEIDSVLGQDALIRQFLLTMGEYGSPESLAAAAKAEAELGRIQAQLNQARPLLVPLINSVLGMTYFWAEDYERALVQFENFSTLGNAATTSYGMQASTIYRMANIYENILNQPEPAGRYYRRLVEEYPNSNMSYYALEKAIALGAFTRNQANKLRLGGLTPQILDELFAAANANGEVSK